jgi:hypothetical protein
MSILSQIAITQTQALASATLGRFDYFVDSSDELFKAYDDTNTLIVVGGSSFASGIDYTLTVPSDWDGTPANVQDALDELASRVKGIEGKTDFITVTAAIDLDDIKAKAESALQSGDNVSELVNDAGYVTSSGGLVDSVTGDGVDNTDPANPVLTFPNADQVDDSTTANKFVTTALIALINSALQNGDNVSELTNDAGYITSSSLPPSFAVDLDSAESSVARAVAGGRTTFTVTHNLNTLDIKPVVFRLSDGRNIGWRIERTGVNTVEASRNGNIADGLFRLVI